MKVKQGRIFDDVMRIETIVKVVIVATHSLTSTSCRDMILCNGIGSKGMITILESLMEMFEGL